MKWTILSLVVVLAVLAGTVAIHTPVSADSGTVDAQVSASTDDASRKHGTSPGWYLTGNDLYAGSVSGNTFGSGMRFDNIVIPRYATIDVAYVTFYAPDTRTGTDVKSRFSAEQVDDPATFANDADAFMDRAANHGVQVDWDFTRAFTAGNWYDGPSIVTVIQELVDRETWDSGDAVVIFWDNFDARTPSGTMNFASKDFSAGQYGAKLHIEWTHVWTPIVDTDPATSILHDGATLNAEAVDDGGGLSVRGFEWGTSSGSYNWSYNATGSFGTGVFSHTITGLSVETTYYFRALVATEDEMAYGSELSFTTTSWPTVATGDTGETGRDWAKVGRSWTLGEETPLVVWMQYRHASDRTWLSSASVEYSSDGSDTVYLDGLTETGRWDYRVAANYTDEGGGTLYGITRQFDIGERDEFARMPTWFPFMLLGVCLLVFFTRSLLLCIGGVIAAMIGFWLVFDPGMNSLPGLGFSALMLLIVGWMMWRVLFASDWMR